MIRDPFALDDVPEPARPFTSWLLRLPEYRRLYRSIASAKDLDASARPFERRVLDALGITIDLSASQLDCLSSQGPLIIAANHPHGLLDGLVLLSICRPFRPDVRVVTNHLLARIPDLHDFCFFVDPFDGPTATARSLHGLRAAHLWLRKGGALIVFPAGEVAHGPIVDRCHLDSAWKPTMERLAHASRARVVRAKIEGGNSALFYAAGKIHPSLRTALLAREFLKKRQATVTVRLEPSAAATLAVFGSTTNTISGEIARLPPQACLVETNTFQVFCVDAASIPETLREIGRLREIAYRAVGEGTGRTLDLDAFDEHYRHLFLWDRDKRCVAGAYRIGQTDEIMNTYGVDGLYTRSLFRYDTELLARIGAPALELGRSFVRAEYQRNYNALLLLWKGIGRFIAQRPRYRFLFGPVSISARYSATSHRLLMAFLHQNALAGELAEVVNAVNPSTPTRAPDTATLIPHDIDEVNRLVAKAEHDGKGIPVLLRQYLKLNARLIGFNVDPAFGDALDALMIVDLTRVDRPILARYLGRAESNAYLAYHDIERRTKAA